MIKGIYSAYSAMASGWEYQEVVANNMANASTIGYKREVAVQESFSDVLLARRTSTPAPFLNVRAQSIGTIGTGSEVTGYRTDFAIGTSASTGNELDLFLEQGYFVIESETDGLFYTRDGRFGRDANGDLVNSQGNFVLDPSGQRIRITPDRVDVANDGTITDEEGTVYGQIGVLDIADADLRRAGAAYFQLNDGAATEQVGGGVRQGFLEASNVDLGGEITTLVTILRTYEANQTVISRLDETLAQAVQTLGQFGR